MENRREMEDLEQMAYLRNWKIKKELKEKQKQEEKEAKKKNKEK